MAVAQGINKQLAYKVQSAKGTTASGSGGQLLRRETATFGLKKDTFSSNEITSHQQHTGDKHGIAKTEGMLNGNLSGETYWDFLCALTRKAEAATSAISSLTLTVAGTGPYTVARSAGDFLTGGIKIGDVVRLTGANLDAANVGKNLLVTGVIDTTLTVVVLNGSTMTAESSKASSTVTVTGKKTWVPTSGHTNLYYTIEEWYSDITKSHVFPDMKAAKADIALPPTGNATIGISFLGLGERTKSGSQSLTTPTAETTSEILSSVNGKLLIGGTTYVTATSLSLSIDTSSSHGEAVIGSNYVTDIQKGDIKVTGSFAVLYENDTLSDFLDSELATSIVAVIAENDDADAEFIGFTMSRVKVFSDDNDDGKKQLVRTYNFTAEINGAGGAALANHQTIIQIQDSLA